MIKIFSILLFLFFTIVVRTQLSLERIDAIMDLSAVAKNYFSEEPNLKYKEPNGEMVNAFAWSISDMWDMNESALYVLTRLAKFVDEKNDMGELSEPARVIRSFAERSEARKVYMTTIESSSSSSTFDIENGNEFIKEMKEEEEIEKLFITGNELEADFRVAQMIEKRWNNNKKAIEDIEIAAKNGQFNLLASLIKHGAYHDSLKFIAPQVKANLIIKLLSLPTAQIHPNTAKWLFTMGSYREDQLKLVKSIEKEVKKRSELGHEKTLYGSKNNLMELFEEVELIQNRDIEENDNYFNVLTDIKKDLKQDELKKVIEPQEKVEEKIIKIQEEQEPKPITQQEEQNSIKENGQIITTQANDKPKERNYFDEQEEQEREIEKIIYENNEDPLYDNDGEYDENEKRSDKVARIVVIAIIGSIIALAVGTYIYLRVRRARRNRTMIVVTEALETVA